MQNPLRTLVVIEIRGGKKQFKLQWALQGNGRFATDSQNHRRRTVIQGQGCFTKRGLPWVIPPVVRMGYYVYLQKIP